MKLVPLTKGFLSKVDDEDFERVIQFKWCATLNAGKIYACRNFFGKKTYMHRFILGIEKSGVDHINGDGLDNQRSNLRPCNQSQNSQNKIPWCKAGIKGIWFWKKRNVFQVKIKVNKKQKTIGYFKTASEAAKAYDDAALLHFGEFAKTNKSLGLLHEI